MILTSILALAIASAVTPAEVQSIDVLASDYPKDAIIRRLQGTVGTTILVVPSGEAEQCELTRPSGYTSLDVATCEALLRRTRFRAAVDGAGTPAYGLVEVPFTWRFPSGAGDIEPFVRAPDYELTIQPRAAKPSADVDVSLAVLVGTDGIISHCDVPAKAEEPVLGRAACGALPNLWVRRVVTRTSGEAVAYVRTVVVHFQTQASE